MSAYDLTFWQVIPSPHQLSTLRALVEMGNKVTLVVDRMQLEERASMGWSLPHLGNVVTIKAIDRNDQLRILSNTYSDSVHLVTGPRGCSSGRLVLDTCLATGRHVGILAECGDPRSITGLIRRIIYKKDAFRYKSVEFVLAMGQTGVDWYVKAGYRKGLVFPYAYTVEQYKFNDVYDSNRSRYYLGFVGSLIELKGIDLLLKALARITMRNWHLTIVGDGPLRNNLQHLAHRLGIEDHISWLGYLPHLETMKVIASLDLMILPSRYDGWGAVVNESLMLGTPMVCSDTCGAADVIRSPRSGNTFESGSITALERTIETMYAIGKVTQSRRQEIVEWASCISGQSVAQHLIAIMDHIYKGASKPIAPWRKVI